jgi:hypothetical protein
MINCRIENIEALVEKLKKEDVTVLDNVETYEYGKFVHILDLEVINRIAEPARESHALL